MRTTRLMLHGFVFRSFSWGRQVLCALLLWFPIILCAQINTDRVMLMGRNALYYEDYVLSIQRFNMVIAAKPYLHEPYFYRGLAKFYLEDFTGAEQDCSESLQRNPYVSNSYQLRGLCRVNLHRYDAAVEDYQKVIGMEPRNRACWHNLVLCHFELKQYDEANKALDQMMRYWPRESENLTMKAQVCIHQGDTVGALAFIDSALVVNAYDGQAWTMRSMISLQHGEYAQAESEIDKAIVQLPRVAGNYINRALARFHQDNLRGAMDDYDHALELEPNNYLGHFNRGLLRAQVGDDNRAIEDFDFVLSVEPDNMLALFNRALLLDQTGDYRAAIHDISMVINEYPDFLVGYQQRAAIRRKIGDVYGAERDEFRVLKARMEARAGVKPKSAAKTRKKSTRNMDDYNKLVEADTEEPKREYASDYRGRVQDHQVELQPMPLYVLGYHTQESATKRYVGFHKSLELLNASGLLGRQVRLTSAEPSIDAAEMQVHFASLSAYTKRIDDGGKDAAALKSSSLAILYFGRALDAYHLRDFEAALSDLERAVVLDGHNPLFYLAMAQIRCRQYEAMGADKDASGVTAQLGYSRALDDLKHAVELSPDLAYAWYDMGNIHMIQHEYGRARDAYSRALNADPRFPEAFYNRGLACILDGQVQKGLSDLSQAGEYGIYQAYNLIKRYSKEK